MVELREKLGGRLDGKPWSSEELQGKVHVLFYVDPDERYSSRLALCAMFLCLFRLISTSAQSGKDGTTCTTPYPYLMGVLGTLSKNPRRAR